MCHQSKDGDNCSSQGIQWFLQGYIGLELQRQQLLMTINFYTIPLYKGIKTWTNEICQKYWLGYEQTK